MKQFNYIVYIGRFQPAHKAHIETIKQALTYSDKVVVLIGSSYQPRTIKNPFNWNEREEMIRASLPDNIQDLVEFRPIKDHPYNDTRWIQNVQEEIDSVVSMDRWDIDQSGENVKVGLIGHSKDESSFYLKCFPQWKFIGMPNIDDLHSTDVREEYFGGEVVTKGLPSGVSSYLTKFKDTIEFDKLTKEYDFIELYKESWSAAPYAPTFVTADAIVVQSGHVLLVKRRASPGAGLFAIPGGFVNQDERIEAAALRELREETKLKIPAPVLKGSITDRKIFDNPSRSLRGRTITQAFLIELPAGALPKVKGSDDAEKAFWMSVNDIKNNPELFFEDHYNILEDMIKF